MAADLHKASDYNGQTGETTVRQLTDQEIADQGQPPSPIPQSVEENKNQ